MKINVILLIVFILSVYEFIRFISILFSSDIELTSMGHKYLAISFITGLLSGLQLFGVYNFIGLLQ